ncbi:MAG TPA: glycosyltransferase family 2 protein [Gammaproteobacteria bacterium]|nr:glycosyltransferase family 2 protein [Gammaproteobacteria bacterium]
MRSVHCIRSLLEDGVDQVMVWDNSADGGRSAANIVDTFKTERRVRVIIHDTNIGFAAGVNRGLERCMDVSQGARVLLINNDAVLLPGASKKLLNALDTCASAWISFPNIQQPDGVTGPVYYNRLTGWLSQISTPTSFVHASGCCLMIATDRISTPLFDEDFFMYGEDAALGWRLRRSPHSMAHVDEVLVVHEGSASSGLRTPFYEMRMVAAHLILVRKLAHNSADAILLYLLRIPTLLTRATIRSLRFHSWTPWVALWKGLQAAYEERSRRRQVGGN